MREVVTLIFILMTMQAFGTSLEDAYKDGLNAAQSSMQKPIDIINNLKPEEAFKDQNGKTDYTATPPQVSYYQEVTKGDQQVLESAGRNNIDKNEATQEAWKSFGNPKFKIEADESWLNKSGDIIKNSADIAIGASSRPGEVVKNGVAAGVNCKEAKTCRIDLVKKTCNEEANHLQKICEKIPKIVVVDEGSFTYSGEILPADDVHVGTFVAPITGTITSFSANFGSWHVQYGLWACDDKGGQYPGYLQNVYVSKSRARSCGEFVETMSYSNGNLNISVEAGKAITFRFDGYVRDRCGKYGCDWRAWTNGRINRHWSSSHYELVIRRKSARVESWSEVNCGEA